MMRFRMFNTATSKSSDSFSGLTFPILFLLININNIHGEACLSRS